jgi:hypothetical protein
VNAVMGLQVSKKERNFAEDEECKSDPQERL